MERVGRVWCEFAALPDGVESGVLVTINNGSIADIDVDVARPDDAMPLDGLTVPGLANAHSHAFHRALRSRTHGGRGDFWSWREQMYTVALRLTPENYVDLAAATYAEMVLAGYTAVGEFHYVHHRPDGQPYDDPNAVGRALMSAAERAGIRLTLLDTCYLRAGAGRALLPEQQRFSDGTAAAWALRVAQLGDSAMVRIGAAIHSTRAVDAAGIATVARFATGRSMPLHAHVSEQMDENAQILQEYGCTPTEILAQQGALSDRFTAVHATHLRPEDVTLYAAAGSTCCFCPTTERDLADGIGPSDQLAAAGVPLSIGSDQHAVIDPFEEMRGIELDERLRSMQRGTHTASSLLAAGTLNGYRSLGWSDGGVIRVGSLADLTTISLSTVRLAGVSKRALVEAAVFAATASDVTDVIIGGRHVVSGGRHTVIDVAPALATSITALFGEGNS